MKFQRDKNKRSHNKIVKIYNLRHSEIYNKIEQDRISIVINKISKMLKKKSKILDFGAGTGNLALKFLKKGFQVYAADVSNKSLEQLKKKSKSSKLNTCIIKNKKLPFSSNYFDCVVTYSVLHHVSDYLFGVKELIRVTKKNGLIYIDHEVNKNRWFPDKNLQKYYKLGKTNIFEKIIKLFRTKELFLPSFWKSLLIKIFIDHRHQREGDIHVWKDDHIEWDKILKIASKNCKIVENKDYLMYNTKAGLRAYNKYRTKCNDTKYIILKKIK